MWVNEQKWRQLVYDRDNAVDAMERMKKRYASDMTASVNWKALEPPVAVYRKTWRDGEAATVIVAGPEKKEINIPSTNESHLAMVAAFEKAIAKR